MEWYKRDGHMIRYLVNHGFFKVGIYPHANIVVK